jgi:hypothetical protein
VNRFTAPHAARRGPEPGHPRHRRGWPVLTALAGSLSTGSFAVQPLWSNYDSGCTLSAP